MTQLTKKAKNREGCSTPSLRNDFLTNRFFSPRLFDVNDEFFDAGLDAPLANITETNKDFKLDLSVPGMKRSDFEINVEDGVLTISSEKEVEEEEEDKNYTRREFSYHSFSRTFTLPDNVDENHINAKYDNGMLEVTIPKMEVTVSKPKKQITVA